MHLKSFISVSLSSFPLAKPESAPPFFPFNFSAHKLADKQRLNASEFGSGMDVYCLCTLCICMDTDTAMCNDFYDD